MAQTIALSLVSHTNVGKTTLARTLLARDVGEVRDAPHVTEFAEQQELLATADGDRLLLWDTPGFGDSERLLRRLRGSGNPIGWLLSQVWDRWRDRAFWGSQQAAHHVREASDVVLYLVNAAEPPEAAAYVAAEMELLDWIGKPVIVLLNQLGPPRASGADAEDVDRWKAQLNRWPRVRRVLPLDAFARCWVHEGALWQAVHAALPPDRQPAMAALHAAWQARQRERFEASMRVLADGLVRLAATRVALDEPDGGGWRRLGAALGLGDGAAAALQAAEQRLADAVASETRAATDALIHLHGLAGSAGGVVLAALGTPLDWRRKVDEGPAALLGGLLSGAATGLAADVAAGGLTLGGGMLAGGLLGALGAAGVARGLNVVRGRERSTVGLGAAALQALVRDALLRYLAVAHFGRGRGQWRDGEAPPHWQAAVDEALAAHAAALQALWPAPGAEAGPEAGRALADAMHPLLARCTDAVLARLYPEAPAAASNNPPP